MVFTWLKHGPQCYQETSWDYCKISEARNLRFSFPQYVYSLWSPPSSLLSWGKQPHPQLKAAILVSHLVCEWEENSRSCWVGHEEDVAQTWILHRDTVKLEQIPWCWHKVFLFLHLWNTKYLSLWNQPFLPFNKIQIIVLSSLDPNSAFTIHPICTWTEKDSESYES